ncbi:hypothetical protein SAY86_014141 [Trapa natans]|uniref:Uncharacterized protein n=1 Tax=Trapa natans TaxID=22666 RepID=A0AAN7QNF6_TRANT|nr:hypothetical protein SAY86_014141 [Trapa natans]
MVVQEYCYFEWENLIAEASRRGCTDERELQWDSYDTLNEQLEQEWLESIEERKTMLRQKGNKNRPKSLDQRRKIAEAIAAKWADPAYRERVCSGLSRYHGVTVDVERKPRRRPSSSTESSGQSPPKRKSSEHDTSRRDPKSQIQRIRLKRSNTPLLKDPLASSKLEMIKNIRAERATSETNRTAAIERARFFITEAEKAAKALEVAATRSPAARASLVETKKLIAEAIQSMESIKTRTTCLVESVSLSSNQSLPCPQHHSQVLSELNDQTHGEERKVNGTAVQLQNPEEVTFKAGYEHPESFNQFQPEESIEKDVKSAGLNDCHSWKEVLLPNGIKHPVASSEENLPREPHRTPMKKWVRGRLVEVME